MREQEPKVLASETLVELVDLKILLKHNTIPVDLKMSWYSGATARPPGEWLTSRLAPLMGLWAQAHAISALSLSIANEPG